ncbi:hypothetical protein K501DRAFT_252810 [Backusella circina FSU 941]|nr:hypothetical protein K501DRAFT_252810 [Backusella circina FSU 941]
MSLPTPLPSPSRSAVNLKLPLALNFEKLPPQQQQKHVKTRKIQAFLGVLKEIDGRDKLMKFTQYMIKLFIYYNIITTTKKKWMQFAAQLSMTRQINNLGNILHHLSGKGQYNLSKLNTMINAISDDIYCLCRLGLLPKAFEYKAERVSAYCWFIGILEDLASNFEDMCELEAKFKLSSRGRDKLYISQISVLKLMMDGLFCGCDIFDFSFSSVVQVWTGLFGALLGGYKVYNRLQ